MNYSQDIDIHYCPEDRDGRDYYYAHDYAKDVSSQEFRTRQDCIDALNAGTVKWEA